MNTPAHAPPDEFLATARLAACAAMLQMAESLLPPILPGIKLGLANVIVLIALVDRGFAVGIQIAIIRVLVAALLLGTFLSPTFLLSVSASITSALVMAVLIAMHPVFSVMGVSIAGAVTHSLTQLFMAYAILFRTPEIFRLTPFLILASVLGGTVTGLFTRSVLLRMSSQTGMPSIPVTGENPLVGEPVPLPATQTSQSLLTLILPLAFLALALLLGDPRQLLGLAILTLVIARDTGLSWRDIQAGFGRIAVLASVALILPALMPGGHAPISLGGRLNIDPQGLRMGLTFSLRLIAIMLTGLLITRYLRRSHVAERLVPRLAQASGTLWRWGALVALSFNLAGDARDSIQARIREAVRQRGIRALWPTLVGLVAELYPHTTPEEART